MKVPGILNRRKQHPSIPIKSQSPVQKDSINEDAEYLTSSQINLNSEASMEKAKQNVEGSYTKTFNPFSLKRKSKDLVQISSFDSAEKDDPIEKRKKVIQEMQAEVLKIGNTNEN